MKLAHLLITLSLATPALVACDDEEPFFRHCPLSETLLQVCEEQETDTELTCVVREHPMCDERVCAAWDGSDSFCSKECASAADCPAESTCETYLDYQVCIPAELPPPLVR